MSRTLRRRLPLGAGETPQSLASRLARRHGLAAYPFCKEIGLSFRRIVHGDPVALADLAEVAGVPLETLVDAAFVDENAFLAFRGERLLASQVRRLHMRFCPHCLRQDIADGDGWRRGEASVFGRGTWLVEQVRTCPVHSMALVALPPPLGRDEIHDVAGRFAPVLLDLDRIASEAAVRQATSFESYVVGRLGGRRDSAWLDGLSLHVAIMTCAGLGMVEACPKDLGRSDLTDDGWRSVEAAGFEIANEGRTGIHAFMERVHSTDESLGHNVARNWGRLGRLFRFFDLHNHDEAFQPAHDVIAGFMADRRAIEGKVLGVVVRRKLHSLATASKQASLSTKALRYVLAAQGLLPDGHEGMRPGSVMVDADSLDVILSSLAARWSERQVSEYLRIPVHQVRLLVGEGVLKVKEMKWIDTSYLRMFDQESTKDFMGRIMAKAEPMDEERPDRVSMDVMSRTLGFPQARIIRLLVENRLKVVKCLSSETGLSSLRFDVEEVRRAIPKSDLSRREAVQMLGIAMDTIHRLKAAGHLRARPKKAGEPNSRADFYTFDEVCRFAERYVSIHAYARSLGTRQDLARSRLSERGVEPVFRREECGADFYLRSEVEI